MKDFPRTLIFQLEYLPQFMISLGYQKTYTLANQDDPHAVIIETLRVVLIHFTFVLCTMHMITPTLQLITCILYVVSCSLVGSTYYSKVVW